MNSEQLGPGLEQPEAVASKKHSILGIISIALALLSVFSCIVAILLFSSSGDVNALSAVQILVNRLAIICTLGLNPIALILGLIALRQKNTNKAFAITGSVLSGIGTCLALALVLLAVLGVAGAMIMDY